MNKKTHYQTSILERFIPVSLEMLIDDCLGAAFLSSEQQLEFKKFCNAYMAVFHAQTHTKLQNLKNIYRPFNPDRDSLTAQKTNTEESLASLKAEVYQVLENANYERLSEQKLNDALNKISPHGVKVSVDFNEFADVALFYRGSAIRTEYIRNWKKFPFKKQPVEVQIYRRLFVLLQPKTRQQWVDYLTAAKKMNLKKAQKKADEIINDQAGYGDEQVIYFKLFKDIPRADLEMMFPNTRVQMRLFDKVKLGVMGSGGTAGGVMATISKLSAAIDPVSALVAVGGFLGVLWRQVAKILSQRAKYSAILTRNLYFYSLDTNMGALTYLIDTAETEECKEAILAYFFLLVSGEISREDLDRRIEDYIKQKYNIPMDFEIDDGLDKLKTSQLLTNTNGLISAVPLTEANSKLKQQWNNVIENKLLFPNEV